MFEEEMKLGIETAVRVGAATAPGLGPVRAKVEVALKRVDARLVEVSRLKQDLRTRRMELRCLLNRSDAKGARPAHAPGLLIAACSEAVNAHPDGLTSAEVVDWLRKNRPDLKTKAVPAVLLRNVENGRLIRDAQGRYRLTP